MRASSSSSSARRAAHPRASSKRKPGDRRLERHGRKLGQVYQRTVGQLADLEQIFQAVSHSRLARREACRARSAAPRPSASPLSASVVHRRQRLLGRRQRTLLDQRVDQDAAVEDAVERRARGARPPPARCERRPRLRSARRAAAPPTPRCARPTVKRPLSPVARARAIDESSSGTTLLVTLGPEQRDRRLGEPCGCAYQGRSVRAAERVAPRRQRSFGELRARRLPGRLVITDVERRDRQQLRRCRPIVCRPFEHRLAAPGHPPGRRHIDDPDSRRWRPRAERRAPRSALSSNDAARSSTPTAAADSCARPNASASTIAAATRPESSVAPSSAASR